LREPISKLLRLPPDQHRRNRSCEVETFLPVGSRKKRYDDVQAAAARGFDEALKTERLEEFADFPGGGHNGRPRYPLARIEIDHHTVGLLDPLKSGVPRVKLEHVHLRQTDEGRLR